MKGHRQDADRTNIPRAYSLLSRFIVVLGVAAQLAVVSFAFLRITERDAFAYSDPGSGALIWQVLVAGVFGGIFYFRKIVDKVRCWRRKERSTAEKVNKADC